jgi:tetratricopeptide (TPR) repeat protein
MQFVKFHGMRCAAAAGMLGLALAPGCGGGLQSTWDEPTTTESPQAHEPDAQARRAELIQQGDEAWTGRDDPERIRAAITAWEGAVEIDGNDAETWSKISRAYYFLADGHLRFSAPDQMGEQFQHGIQASERALRALSPEFAQRMAAGELMQNAVASLTDPAATPPLYWRATNLGKWAQTQGFDEVLNRKDEIRAMMTRCMELDRYYFHAGPDRYFGAFFAIAPSFAGGDLDRSLQHFEESMRRENNYFGTHVLLAENYAVKRQDRALFEQHLRFVIDGDPESLADVAPENRIEQRKARDLLARIDELFE